MKPNIALQKKVQIIALSAQFMKQKWTFAKVWRYILLHPIQALTRFHLLCDKAFIFSSKYYKLKLLFSNKFWIFNTPRTVPVSDVDRDAYILMSTKSREHEAHQCNKFCKINQMIKIKKRISKMVRIEWVWKHWIRMLQFECMTNSSFAWIVRNEINTHTHFSLFLTLWHKSRHKIRSDL